uniref:Uncharacterized protein n=1 Tax=Solanum lycopersicum TaxID=4081 RepID=A0A3Q7HE35_SOLLC
SNVIRRHNSTIFEVFIKCDIEFCLVERFGSYNSPTIKFNFKPKRKKNIKKEKLYVVLRILIKLKIPKPFEITTPKIISLSCCLAHELAELQKD